MVLDQHGRNSVTTHFVVTNLAGTEPTGFDVTSQGAERQAQVLAVGAQWAEVGTSCYHCLFLTVDVNWRTGEQRDGNGLDVTTYPALDLAASPLRKLCAPAQRAVVSEAAAETEFTRLTPVAVRGRWTQVTGVPPFDGSGTPPSSRLYRCGSSKPVALPKAMTYPVLGDGWLVEAVKTGKTRRLELVRLSDHRRLWVAGFSQTTLNGQAQSRSMWFTKGRLYVEGYDAGAGTKTVSTVQLPKH